MRRLTLIGIFLTLCVAIFGLWQNRFVPAPEFKNLRLSDLRSNDPLPQGAEWVGEGDQLAIRLQPGSVVRLDLPAVTAVDWLFVRYRPTTVNLRPGKMPWDDGRAMLEWHQSSGGPWENDPVCSARGDQHPGDAEWVMRPENGPAVPALRVEHLGTTGTFELSRFEAMVVRETQLWKIGRWVLMLAFLVWAVAWIGTTGKHRPAHSLLAAFIWLLAGLYFVVPGPWKSLHPLCRPFPMAEEIRRSEPVRPFVIQSTQSRSEQPEVLKSVGEIPEKGDFTLRLKHVAKHARTLLHILLLFGPTFLIACLVGKRAAISLCGIFAIAVEAAQFCFGYGFDWVDCVDLTCDAFGILLALRACDWFMRKAGAFFEARRIRAAGS